MKTAAKCNGRSCEEQTQNTDGCLTFKYLNDNILLKAEYSTLLLGTVSHGYSFSSVNLRAVQPMEIREAKVKAKLYLDSVNRLTLCR